MRDHFFTYKVFFLIEPRWFFIRVGECRKPPSYVPYKDTYVPYIGTFGAPDQGQMLDVWHGEDSQVHHLIRQIHRFIVTSNYKKLNQPILYVEV